MDGAGVGVRREEERILFPEAVVVDVIPSVAVVVLLHFEPMVSSD